MHQNIKSLTSLGWQIAPAFCRLSWHWTQTVLERLTTVSSWLLGAEDIWASENRLNVCRWLRFAKWATKSISPHCCYNTHKPGRICTIFGWLCITDEHGSKSWTFHPPKILFLGAVSESPPRHQWHDSKIWPVFLHWQDVKMALACHVRRSANKPQRIIHAHDSLLYIFCVNACSELLVATSPRWSIAQSQPSHSRLASWIHSSWSGATFFGQPFRRQQHCSM